MVKGLLFRCLSHQRVSLAKIGMLATSCSRDRQVSLPCPSRRTHILCRLGTSRKVVVSPNLDTAPFPILLQRFFNEPLQPLHLLHANPWKHVRTTSILSTERPYRGISSTAIGTPPAFCTTHNSRWAFIASVMALLLSVAPSCDGSSIGGVSESVKRRM
jgi:hypothetical protein